MALMLADPIISQFPILAIQEPFHSSYIISTHNPSYTSFHLFHPNVENFRVCFFINKSVNSSSWSGDFQSPDYGYLRLKSMVPGTRDIIIHNIYRPQSSSSFISKFSQESDFSDFFSATTNTSDAFSLLYNTLLDTSAEHILLGDFNLYHPLWGGENAKTDTLSENFISFFNAHFLLLLLPRGTITHFNKSSETTIDLVLVSPPPEKCIGILWCQGGPPPGV